MKKMLLLSLSLLCVAGSANAKDTKTGGSCNLLPMRSGIISLSEPGFEGKRSGTIFVASGNDDVYSLTTGEIVSTVKIADASGGPSNIVIVRYATDSLIAYSRLHSASVKKGDKINKGQLIGKASFDTASGKNEVGVVMYAKLTEQAAKELPDFLLLSLIKNFDN